MDDSMFRYWAKNSRDDFSYHPLPYHSLDVAAVGYTYLLHDELICSRITNLCGISLAKTPELVAFLLSLHDLGKFSETFQSKIPNLFLSLRGREAKPRGSASHDTIGMVMWNTHLKEFLFRERLFKDEDGRTLRKISHALDPLFCAVFGHHGRPPRLEDSRDFFVPEDTQTAQEFISEILGIFSIEGKHVRVLAQHGSGRALNVLSWPLAGLVVFSDWIASNTQLFPYQTENIPLHQYFWEQAVPRAKYALRVLNVLPVPVSPNRGITRLFPEFAKGLFLPSKLQKYTSEIQPGPGPHLFIIEEATGSGKTEAALTLAHQLIAEGCGHGFYFGLPTMATSNAMWERIRAIKENFFATDTAPPVVLTHSARQLVSFLPVIQSVKTNSLPDEERGEDLSHWLEDNRKKALLAALGVGTIDQALVAVLPRRHQPLRLFGLWRNVLIVDEVHAYDPYVNELLRNLICDHARIGGSTILLSATLPASTRNELVRAFCEGAGISFQEADMGPYPLVTHISPSSQGQERIPVEPRPGTERDIALEFFEDEESVISTLLKAHKSGRCACWIRNTVRDAKDAYRRLRSLLTDPETLLLFHARYVLGDRLEREDEVIRLFGKQSRAEERTGKILIATQVVEQSLDLDFDYMVTDLAPIDLVIQRSGRLHRHPRGERGRPILGIHAPAWEEEPGEDWYSRKFPRAAWVYPSHGELWLTLQILRQSAAIRLPNNARNLIEWVYGKDASKRIPGTLTTRDSRFSTDQANRGIAMTNVIKFNSGYRATDSSWPEEEVVPTRLAEPMITLRLGVVDEEGGTIWPLYDGGEHSWEMSQVPIHKLSIGGITYVNEMVHLVESAKKKMRDGGKYTFLVPLVWHEEDHWENTFPRAGKKEIRISYTKEEGLSIDES